MGPRPQAATVTTLIPWELASRKGIKMKGFFTLILEREPVAEERENPAVQLVGSNFASGRGHAGPLASLEPWPKQEHRGLLKRQAARQRVRHRTRNIRRRYSGQRCQRLSDAVPRLVRSFPTRTCHTTAQRLSQASPVLQRDLLNEVHPRRLCWNSSLR